MASSSLPYFTVLTEEDDIPGSKFEREPEEYVDSGFMHDIMDMVNSERYFVQAHDWLSIRTELLHNVIVVISVNSGAVLHASCEPCRASS